MLYGTLTGFVHALVNLDGACDSGLRCLVHRAARVCGKLNGLSALHLALLVRQTFCHRHLCADGDGEEEDNKEARSTCGF